jgi:hypothetical protein
MIRRGGLPSVRRSWSIVDGKLKMMKKRRRSEEKKWWEKAVLKIDLQAHHISNSAFWLRRTSFSVNPFVCTQ